MRTIYHLNRGLKLCWPEMKRKVLKLRFKCWWAHVAYCWRYVCVTCRALCQHWYCTRYCVFVPLTATTGSRRWRFWMPPMSLCHWVKWGDANRDHRGHPYDWSTTELPTDSQWCINVHFLFKGRALVALVFLCLATSPVPLCFPLSHSMCITRLFSVKDLR